MARLNGAEVIKSDLFTYILPTVNIKGESLMMFNVGESRNDKQIVALRDYYTSKVGVDPFAQTI